ncbi:hypothetical protein Poli38472_009830 [Pythium oligandrum]|uniref:Calcineurin-binding protein cabin-1 n=1 Tax=Pythium oligandrum TaxID=41045 RepID=A0A8K1CHQ3_PYTOL|nr:hypothetical protein Poli38472_009830 [Pythium oligandrum]|eukprot:TMW62337.1 hypothetical protein Poli38472_009830 [Pythium oligandrum]
MASWAALNAHAVALDRDVAGDQATAEAQEAHFASLYEQALRFQQQQMISDAKTTYLELLEGGDTLSPRLRYLCYKNLATLEADRQAYEDAVQYFSEALVYDDTDVIVWYHLGKAAIETERLWLARRALESGFALDKTFWPLVQKLCEVLHAIGDYDEFRRVADYLLERDPYCTSVRNLRVSVETRDSSEGGQQLATRAHEAAVNGLKKRRLLCAEAEDHSKALEAREPIEYLLQHCSWHSLGKLLLQAYEDVNTEAARGSQAGAKVRVLVNFESETPHPPPVQQSDVAPEVECGQDYVRPEASETPIVATIGEPPESTPVEKDVTDLVNTDSHESDHEGADQDAPARRKSRRHQEKLREEHEAAVKSAREKDLEYRLQAFLPTLPDAEKLVIDIPGSFFASSSNGPKLDIRLVEGKLQVYERTPSAPSCGVVRKTFDQVKALPDELHASSISTPGQGVIGTSASEHIRVSSSIRGHQISEFVQAHIHASGARVLAVLRQYLNQCGEWAQCRLGGDNEEDGIHQTCFWAEKVIGGGLLNESMPTKKAKTSRVGLERQSSEGLSSNARLFLLELHLDELLVHRSAGRKFRKDRHVLEDLLASAQNLLLDVCYGDSAEDDELPAMVLARIFWLCGLICEQLGNPNVARDHFNKCLNVILTDDDNHAPINLPNLRTEREISSTIVEAKISSLQFSDVCADARDHVAKGLYSDARKKLTHHFFSVDNNSRIIELLQDYASDRQDVNAMSLVELIVFSIEGSTDIFPGMKVEMLVALAHDFQAYLEKARQSQPSDEESELCASAIRSIAFLVDRLCLLVADADLSEDHQLLVRVFGTKLLAPSTLLLFDSPVDILLRAYELHGFQSVDQEWDNKNHETVTDFMTVMSKCFDVMRAKTPDVTFVLATIQEVPKKKTKQQVVDERVRMILFEILRFLVMSKQLVSKLPPAHACIIMKHCCKLIKEGEETARRHADKTTKDLLLASSMAFVQLYEVTAGSDDVSLKAIVSLVTLLHDRLGNCELCTAKISSRRKEDHNVSPSFVDVVADMLVNRLVAKDASGVQLPQKEDMKDDEDGDVESEEDELELAVSQCFRCLYDVHLLPGGTDHKTGGTLASMDSDPTLKVRKVLRLSQFAVSTMLKRTPKSNTQKKENMRVLQAIRSAASSDRWTMPPVEPSQQLLKYLTPENLLEWQDPVQLPSSSAAVNEDQSPDACLDHLWYLLGENYILPRVRRRNNLNELFDMEQKVKERIAYLMKDVKYFRPNRVNSWLRMGKTVKELYHVTSDACNLLLGRQRKMQTLQAYINRCFRDKLSPSDSASTRPSLSFDDVVLGVSLFEKMKMWQDQAGDVRGDFLISISKSTGENEQLSMEDFSVRYIVQLVEFSIRCFRFATMLAQLELDQGSSATTSLHGDDPEDLRDTMIESLEECGLLLYNILQEFAVFRHDASQSDGIRESTYRRIIDATLECFKKGLEACQNDPESHEVRFRFNYMIGKVLKKKQWLDRDAAASKLIMEYFANAEQCHEDGKMEKAIVHAFYQLQAMRMDLLLKEPATMSNLSLVCEHYFEEAPGDDENEDDDEDTDASAEEKAADDDVSSPVKIGKTDVFRMLELASSDKHNLQIARVWLFLNVVEALESIPDEDRYFHPSRYVLARGIYYLDKLNDPSMDGLSASSISAYNALMKRRDANGKGSAAEIALKELAPLFDKRRPQVVAIWLSEHISTAKKFEELNQRQMKFDYYRLKYWRFYVQLLRDSNDYTRLKEVTSWVLACKEEHDVVDEMVGIALEALGVVQLSRLRQFVVEMNDAEPTKPDIGNILSSDDAIDLTREDDPSDGLQKLLGKAYIYYLDVVESRRRVEGILPGIVPITMKHAESALICLYTIGRFRFPASFESGESIEMFTAPYVASVAVALTNMLLHDADIAFDDASIDWSGLFDAARMYCEVKWPDRLGKAKQPSKPRTKAKPPTVPPPAASLPSTPSVATTDELPTETMHVDGSLV